MRQNSLPVVRRSSNRTRRRFGVGRSQGGASGVSDGYRPNLNVSPAVSRSWATPVPSTLVRHPLPPRPKMLPAASISVNMSLASVRIATRSEKNDLAPIPKPPEKRHSLERPDSWGRSVSHPNFPCRKLSHVRPARPRTRPDPPAVRDPRRTPSTYPQLTQPPRQYGGSARSWTSSISGARRRPRR